MSEAPLVPLSGVELRGLIQARDICESIGDQEAVAGIRSILKRGMMYVDDWVQAVSCTCDRVGNTGQTFSSVDVCPVHYDREKYCCHPACKDTNWGGKNRVHTRSSGCPQEG